MKKLIKKLTALALSGAMILSLGVSALADDDEREVYDSDSYQGTITNEGGLPENPIKVIFPTVPEGVFNMFLDPNELISKTNAAKYGGASAAKFEEGSKLFFLTDGTKTPKEYTSSSAKLALINKSDLDVDVDVTLEVNKGGDDFELVATKDALADVTDGPAMYIAVTDGTSTEAAEAAEGSEIPDVVGSFTNDANYALVTGVEFAYADGVGDDAKAAFAYALDAAGKSATLTFADNDDQITVGNFTVTGYTFTASAATIAAATVSADLTYTVTKTADSSSIGTVTVSFDSSVTLPDRDDGTTADFVITLTGADAPAAPAEEVNVEATVAGTLYGNAAFAYAADLDAAEKTAFEHALGSIGVTATLAYTENDESVTGGTFTGPTGYGIATATTFSNLSALPASLEYTVTKTAGNVEIGTLTLSNKAASALGADENFAITLTGTDPVYVENASFTNGDLAMVKNVAFAYDAGISDQDKADFIAALATAATATLTYTDTSDSLAFGALTIAGYTATCSATDLTGTFDAAANNMPASYTYTIVKTSGSVAIGVLTVTTDKTITIPDSDNADNNSTSTIQLGRVEEGTGAAGSSFDADASAVLSASIAKNANAYTYAYDATTQKYIRQLDTTLANSAFNKMEFNLTGDINSEGWDEITGVTVNVIWDVHEASAPVIVEEKDPSVKVTTAATGGSGNAVLTIDLGGGSKAMAKANKVFYQKSGKTVDLEITTATISGTTVTIPMTDLIWAGHDWKVQFTDAAGTEATAKMVTFDIKTVTAD